MLRRVLLRRRGRRRGVARWETWRGRDYVGRRGAGRFQRKSDVGLVLVLFSFGIPLVVLG